MGRVRGEFAVPRWRSRFAGAVAATALIVLGGIVAADNSGTLERASADEPDPPNVIFFMVDDANRRDMNVMRWTREWFQRRGVKFSRAYTSFPLCCPSRASILTGEYAHNHGVFSNRPEDGGGYEGYDDSDSLPVALEAEGYRTAMAGKYLGGYQGPEVPQGWSRWMARTNGIRMFNYNLIVDGEVREFRQQYFTDVIGHKARAFVGNAERSEPFFLFLSHLAPHVNGGRQRDPIPAPRHRTRFLKRKLPRPPSFNEADVSDKPSFVQAKEKILGEELREHRNSRLAALLSVDEGFKGLIRTLRRRGELANTLVIFTSDNGYLLGEHRMRQKVLLYEESAGVPLYMAGPGVPAGGTRRQIAANIDFAPTIYDITGAAPLRPYDGISLLPLAQDPDVEADRDVLLENHHDATGVRGPRYVYIEHNRDGEDGPDEFELYDMQTDPHQLDNLHVVDEPEVRPDVLDKRPELAGVRSQLRDRLQELRDCAGDDCR